MKYNWFYRANTIASNPAVYIMAATDKDKNK